MNLDDYIIINFEENNFVHKNDINKCINNKKNTLLIDSCFKNNYKLAKKLIQNNCDVNIQNCAGSTALHVSIIKNNFQITKLLISNGANINIQNKAKFSPYDYAAKFFFNNTSYKFNEIEEKIYNIVYKKRLENYYIPLLWVLKQKLGFYIII